MEWLKKLIGEERYKLLDENTLNALKAGLGNMEYIPNDPTKVIPKHVFNEKNEENKLLKAQIEQYKTQLKDVGGMITDTELKTKLAEQELTFKNSIKELENNYRKDVENEQKKYLLTNFLVNNKAQHSDLLLKIIDFDQVVVKDGKLLNGESIINPLKETYKKLFEPDLKPGVLPGGNTSQPMSSKEELIKKYNAYEQNGDFVNMMKVKEEIKSLKE